MIIEKESDLWCTPPELIKELADACGGFFMDACCNPDNCIVPAQKEYMQKKKDKGVIYDYLATDPRDWAEYLHEKKNFPVCSLNTIFMNPPYSDPSLFMEKAWEDSRYFRIVCLVKADMSTDWFNFALEADENEHGPTVFHHINPEWSRAQFLSIAFHKMADLKKHGWRLPVSIIHLRKRVKFHYNGVQAKSSGTFPSCVVIYDRRGW